MAPSEVRQVAVRWQFQGQSNAEACSALSIDNLGARFLSAEGDDLAFAPLVCPGGLFTIDKLPLRFNQVQLVAARGDQVVASGTATLPQASGEVVLTLR